MSKHWAWSRIFSSLRSAGSQRVYIVVCHRHNFGINEKFPGIFPSCFKHWGVSMVLFHIFVWGTVWNSRKRGNVGLTLWPAKYLQTTRAIVRKEFVRAPYHLIVICRSSNSTCSSPWISLVVLFLAQILWSQTLSLQFKGLKNWRERWLNRL